MVSNYDGGSRAKQNAESTRHSILHAAGNLFAERGFAAVTMREIARAAKCSHTAIYLYFPDKAALLEALAKPQLEELLARFEAIAAAQEAADERLLEMSRAFIELSLTHRSMFRVLFTANAGRVDVELAPGGVEELRVSLFKTLRTTLAEALALDEEQDEQKLRFARVFYYMLHGIAGTYAESAESGEQLMGRLEQTFESAVRVLLAGFRGELGESKQANRERIDS